MLRLYRILSVLYFSGVWSGSRSCAKQDRQATAKLLEIMKRYQIQEMFSNKRMRKREVWMEVAKELMAAGFQFRNKECAWEKVSQKWRNMERTYRIHVSSILAKGSTEGCRSMEFFDQLHELLADKYNTESVAESVLPDHDANYFSQNEDSQMTNGDYEEQPEETAETSSNLLQADMSYYDNYVEDELPPSPTFSDNKNLVFGLPDPHTADVRDPVVRLLLEMRAQERAHFREDRRERLKMQKEAQEFRRDLVNMLNQQHQEKMQVMQNLIAAIGANANHL